MTDAATASVDPWSEVVGQDRAVSLLRSAVDAPVHAWLFLGPSGSGKRAAARAFADLHKPTRLRRKEIVLVQRNRQRGGI